MEQQIEHKQGEKKGLDSKVLAPAEVALATPTPEKTTEPKPLIRHTAGAGADADQLSEKYKMILEFFDRMTCSLRLLRLRKKPPTFRNVSSQVEKMTARKFEHKHLAQIKYILPEAIQIGKILVHDAETMCMKPDINITLFFDAVEGHDEQSDYIALGSVFACRLTNFLSTHPEVCDIPEAVLPVQFNQTDIITKADTWHLDVSTSTEREQVKLSHFSPSFSRRFSEKAIVTEMDKTILLASPFTCSSSTDNYVTDSQTDKLRASADSSSSQSSISRSSVQASILELHASSSTCKSSPIKTATESEDIILETPAQSTPKRSHPTCEDKDKTMNQICMSGNQSAKRSLDFSKLDGEETFLDFIKYEIEQSKPLPNSSAQIEETGKSVKGESAPLLTTFCKDGKSSFSNGKDSESSQSCLASHEQTSVCLSDLVLTIHHIFQSVNCRSITKEELIHKILMNSFVIDDKSEIEEQIEHLEKMVPDWICKTSTPSGDLLYSIRMVSDLNSVHERVISI